eukprot:6529483-Ditylum_brightwellii.AAC.1
MEQQQSPHEGEQQGEEGEQLTQDDMKDMDSIQQNTNDMPPNDEQSTIDVDTQTDELQTPSHRRCLTQTHHQQQQQPAKMTYLQCKEQHLFI